MVIVMDGLGGCKGSPVVRLAMSDYQAIIGRSRQGYSQYNEHNTAIEDIDVLPPAGLYGLEGGQKVRLKLLSAELS